MKSHLLLPMVLALCLALYNAQPASALTAAEAKASLSAQAAAKLAAGSRLLDTEPVEVIVEYHAPQATALLASGNVSSQTMQRAKALFASAKQQALSSASAQELRQLRDFDALPMNFVRVNRRGALLQLLNNPNVKAVHENKAHRANLAQSLGLIRQPQALAAGFGGAGTTVAVLDTGAFFDRAAFGSCTAPNQPAGCRVVAALDIAANDGLRDDGSVHGTNVAGIVAGVAPQARLAVLDVFRGSLAYTIDIISGINWAINNKSQYNIVAMNLSLGTRGIKYTGECPSSYATTPFSQARAVGIIPVVAAGNDGFADGVGEPACAPGAVRVGAVYDASLGPMTWTQARCTDAITSVDRVTCFSNSSNLITVLAPGSIINAAGLNTSGTSQAAPHVAGAIAVLRATNAAPRDTLEQTMIRITSTGPMLTDAKNGVAKPRLDLLAAVNTISRPVARVTWLTPVLDLLTDE
jgi:subtilisin family serine protease